MKIGTYNLEFLYDEGTHLFSGKEYYFSKEFVEKRFVYFAQQFDNLDVDIFFLQELGDESALVKILEKTREQYNYFIGEPDKNGVGNAVIYKKDIICTCTSIPTKTSFPVFNESDEDIIGQGIFSRRDYVHLETVYKGRPIVMLGIHIKSNFLMYKNADSSAPENVTQLDTLDGVIRSEVFRFIQAKKVREVIQESFNLDGEAQVIVLGDFNATQENKVFEIIRGHMKKRPDALVPILEAIPVEKRYSIVGSHYNGLIDHVLVSQALKENIDDVLIHNEAITNHAHNPEYPYIIESDHAPITFCLN